MGLKVFRYDLLLVDEAQDLNRCQQALAKMAGHRLIFCGDDKQAIYGFAGADAESLPRLQQELTVTAQGCTVLPLTVTRRCGKAIVEEAKKIVPDFEAFEGNGPGEVGEAAYPIQYDANDRPFEIPFEKSYMASVRSGDFIICRVNAPLVSQCFKFLKRGIRANIQGRDIGRGLIATVKKLDSKSVEDLVKSVTDWAHEETKLERAKRNPSDARVIAIADRADCLVCFTEGSRSVEDVIRNIERVFTDDKSHGEGIRLSSIHKAKGLEAKHVFFLMPKGAGCPHPSARSNWAIDQEYNLRYVGITRAIETLTYVY